MTKRCLHGCGMSLTGAIEEGRFYSSNSATPASRFQQRPRPSDPPQAGYLFPSPAPPPPLLFPEPEAASLSGFPLVLANLLDSHPLQADEFEEVNLESEPILLPESEVATSDAARRHASIRPSAKLVAPAGIAISVLGVLLFGPSPLMMERSVAAKDHPALEQVSLPGSSVPQPTPPETPAATVVAAQAQTSQPAFGEAKSSVSVQASDRSWIVACADSKVLFARLFTAGNSHTIEFKRRAIVRVGSAGSVQILDDGRFPGTLGDVGEVRIVEFTPGDSHFLKGGEIEDCTKGL